jgi:hypothetical protein
MLTGMLLPNVHNDAVALGRWLSRPGEMLAMLSARQAPGSIVAWPTLYRREKRRSLSTVKVLQMKHFCFIFEQ